MVCGKFVRLAFQMLLFGEIHFELCKSSETPNV